MKNYIWYWRDKIRYQILVFGKWFEGQSEEAEKEEGNEELKSVMQLIE